MSKMCCPRYPHEYRSFSTELGICMSLLMYKNVFIHPAQSRHTKKKKKKETRAYCLIFLLIIQTKTNVSELQRDVPSAYFVHRLDARLRQQRKSREWTYCQRLDGWARGETVPVWPYCQKLAAR